MEPMNADEFEVHQRKVTKDFAQMIIWNWIRKERASLIDINPELSDLFYAEQHCTCEPGAPCELCHHASVLAFLDGEIEQFEEQYHNEPNAKSGPQTFFDIN